MREFLNEVMVTFPDELLHLGGDEVDTKCWYVLVFILNSGRNTVFSYLLEYNPLL